MGVKRAFHFSMFFTVFSFIFFVSVISSSVFAGPLPYYYITALPEEKSFDAHAAFATDFSTGAATYTYEFKAPSGTNDLEPELSLSYNSHLRHSPPTVTGRGWQLTENYIQRNSNFTLNTADDDFYILVFNGASHELVNTTTIDGLFHTKIESFLHIQQLNGSINNTNNSSYWAMKTPDGTTYTYGYNNESEMVGSVDGIVWRWSLDSIQDTYNNTVFYNYSENLFGDNGTVYLDKITYNNDQQRIIEFIFESDDRSDIWEYFDHGNRIKQKRRLQEIRVSANSAPVRSYLFWYNYSAGVAGGSAPIASLLTGIVEVGGDNVTALPIVQFNYTFPRPEFKDSGQYYAMADCGAENRGCFVTSSGADNANRFADINRDGLLDIIRARYVDGNPTVFFNTGKGTWVENGSFIYPSCSNGGDTTMCFVNSNDEDNGVRLADVNNDGYTDLVKADDPTSGDPVSKVYIGKNSGWMENASLFSYPKCNGFANNDLCFSRDGKNHGVALADVNGDGLPDIVKAKQWSGDPTSSAIWLNNGSGWEETNTITYPECDGGSGNLCFITADHGVTGEDNGIRLSDVNGDGLLDIVKGRQGSDSTVRFNTGKGWGLGTDIPKCTPGDADLCFVDDFGNDRGVRLIDVNGDGLDDIVRATYTNSQNAETKVYIGNGRSWSEPSPAITFPECSGDSNAGCFLNSGTNTDRGVRLADVDGDGLADHLIAHATGSNVRTYINQANFTGLLDDINHSYGGSTQITYKRSTFVDSNGFVFHRGDDDLSDLGFSLMVVESVTNNNGMNTSHHTNITTLYQFANGLYDYKTKEFRGFGNATEEESNTTIITHRFHQDDGKKGKEYKTETIDNETKLLYQQKDFTWDATLNNGYYTTLLLEENASQFDGATIPKISNTSYEYDSYGNILSKATGGDLALAGDERYEYIDFVYNTSLWIVQTQQQRRLYDADNTTLLREIKYTYDGQTFGDGPLRGDITKQEQTVEGVNISTTQYTYDSYGNVLTKTDPNNRQITFTYGADDPTFTFADTETNAKGHIVKRWYDLGTGNLLAVNDSNGFGTNFTYDVLGRITAEIKPLDTLAYPTKVYTYAFDGVSPEKVKVQLREQNETTNTLDLYEFIDGLGKVIQTKVEAENGKQIVEDTFYDDRQLVKSKSNKYFIPFEEEYTAPSSTGNWTNFTYDALERPIKVINPDDSEQRFVYDRWNETQIDAQGNQKEIIRDAYNQIVQVIEFNPDPINTNYTYNTAGELLRAHDASDNLLNYTYDLAGRKRTETDGDIGTKIFTYDPAGNVVEVYESHGNVTTFVYDELNRLINKSTTFETYFYIYDTPIKGTLSSMSSANFTRAYDYDERLRIQGETKTIDGIAHSLRHSYDSLDRPTGKELPTRDALAYTYTTQGILNSLTVGLTPATLISSTTHIETNAPLLRTYGNSATTQFAYNESNFRLQKLQTGTKQNLAYTFDNAANVVAIEDSIHSRTYAMLYDKLSRLTGTTRHDGSEEIFNFTYAYNAIGNMLSIRSPKENLTFSYNGTTTHAPYRIDYEAEAEGIVIDSLNNLTGGSLTVIFEFVVNNTENIDMSDVSWSLFTDATNITSQGNLTLQPREDIFVYAQYTYGGAGTYPVLVTVAGASNATEIWFNANQTMSVTVP